MNFVYILYQKHQTVTRAPRILFLISSIKCMLWTFIRITSSRKWRNTENYSMLIQSTPLEPCITESQINNTANMRARTKIAIYKRTFKNKVIYSTWKLVILHSFIPWSCCMSVISVHWFYSTSCFLNLGSNSWGQVRVLKNHVIIRYVSSDWKLTIISHSKAHEIFYQLNCISSVCAEF